MKSQLGVETNDWVTRVTLRRPEALNALDEDLTLELVDVLARLDADDATRVIVLTGEGPEVRPEAEVAGAHALVPKGTRLGPLLRCLRTVAVGGTGCPYCL